MGQAVTERAASQLACHEARVEVASETGATSVNRQPSKSDPFSGAHCIGSTGLGWPRQVWTRRGSAACQVDQTDKSR